MANPRKWQTRQSQGIIIIMIGPESNEPWAVIERPDNSRAVIEAAFEAIELQLLLCVQLPNGGLRVMRLTGQERLRDEAVYEFTGHLISHSAVKTCIRAKVADDDKPALYHAYERHED